METIFVLWENDWYAWEHDIINDIAYSKNKALLEEIAEGLFLEAVKDWVTENEQKGESEENVSIERGERLIVETLRYSTGKSYFITEETLI